MLLTIGTPALVNAESVRLERAIDAFSNKSFITGIFSLNLSIAGRVALFTLKKCHPPIMPIAIAATMYHFSANQSPIPNMITVIDGSSMLKVEKTSLNFGTKNMKKNTRISTANVITKPG